MPAGSTGESRLGGATPYVNLRHPERSTDLILLVDTFSASVLPRQVRAAAGLARTALARHDRVGLVGFGGVLHWVDPAIGQVQLERLVAALSATRVAPLLCLEKCRDNPLAHFAGDRVCHSHQPARRPANAERTRDNPG